jgi:fatty acid synthase
VGGGVGDQQRASELLLGTWASRYGLINMPVDAIFLGTICMAVKEAKTSPQVKKSLVETAGDKDWVYAGTSKGQMTSGKSQLNADIHYVDNFAAQCGRLLDSVAGNAEAVAEKREEIIEAINKTAKPYFGDVENMTYAVLLRRMLTLMAVGIHDRYEDGRWPDLSFRQRFADMIWRAEARLHTQQEGHFPSVLKQLRELDQPEVVLEKFLNIYTTASIHQLHPADAEYFLSSICRRPGKPVNFVPVIDEDVRRWYKSDSLWFSHDPRFEADQVLIIPGPEAIAGIDREDEPISELFSRFLEDMHTQIEKEPLLNQKEKQQNRTLNHGISVTMKADRLSLYVDSSEVDWFSIFPASLQQGTFSFWGAAQVLSGDRLEESILRKICKPQEGSKLHITEGQIVCHPFLNRNVWVSIVEDEEGIIVV